MSADALLANLNQSQHAAVSSFADQLAILAGPGSGKTHTLTSRTAWLLSQGLQPWNVIVATFTVKAAREMKERIGKLLGNGLESKLILGTFHSIARRYLARYGHLIEIRKDFGIADSADSLAIIKRIIKRNNFSIDPKAARSRISSRKARGAEKEQAANTSGAKSIEIQEIEACYKEYEEALQRSNLLDYDDLLLRCVDLLRNHPSCVSNVEAVLIDEFQDTNIVQFDLMRLFASHRKRITIVGDPDQSIYGFRAAETKNYKRMLHQYPDTVTIALEENYRSSGAILLTALSVIEQDKSRVAKSLLATHIVGTRPVLRQLPNAQKEADWIITEIQRVLGLTGDLMDLNDIAILLRSASLSRLIESSLGKAGIAYRMVGGLRFYDRVEVKTILDYLRVINQPDNNDALSRIINIPSRRIGDATIKSLLEEADQNKITLWCLILAIAQGKRTPKTKLPKQTDQGLSRFVNLILTARGKMAGPQKEQLTIVDMIKFITQKTDYETWLEEHHADVHKARWANVEELMTQAKDFQEQISYGYEDESLPQVDGLEQTEDSDHLSKFLANVALASEVKKDDAEGSETAQVTISTIHAAKGLEWPIVFVPAAYQGSIPHSRAEDENEERRLLYVAMTRAKALLYLSCPSKSSQGEKTTLSPFLSPTALTPLLDQRGPSILSSTVQSISQILRRALPSLASISKSSALLPSSEDNIFAVESDDENHDAESILKCAAGHARFTMGQQAPKRRRIELGRSISNLEQRQESDWKPSYTTTMGRASTFTSASTTLKRDFISAGSHLEGLKEQSTNPALSELQESEDPRKQTKMKLSSKPKSAKLEGQGTLLGFLGKVETLPTNHPSKLNSDTETSKPHYGITNRNINTPRVIQKEVGNAIAPALATHRVGVANIIRPPQHTTKEEHRRNDYIFLSSSPPRPKLPTVPEPSPPKPPGLTAKPPLLPLIRPAISTRNTTVNKLKHSNIGKRTLGVKRSMNGWPSQREFVPPTMKRTS